MNFEIIHKPTFTNQLLAIPKEMVVQILEKIEVLRNDPKPHGKLKKKLHSYKGDVYRLRSGDYRIIYTYGDGWVALMGVDARKDVYKGDKLVAQMAEIDINALPDVETVLAIKPSYKNDFTSPNVSAIAQTLLPTSLTEELLERLRIPEEYWHSFIACKSLEDLTAIKLPSKWCDTQICASPNRLFITADANQSIYGSSFRWSDVHQDLKFVGRTGVLRVNHRTTHEINEAAIAYLTNGALDDLEKEREYIHSGPAPAVWAVNNAADEGELLTRFCKAATHEFRLGISSCAVIVPTESAGTKIAGQLSYLGLEAHFMNSKELDLNKPGVKVITLKAAKGLEFPIVAIAGFLDATYPTIPKGTPDEEITEILARERRTLFVAMTRAMRALLVIVPGSNSSALLENFDSQLWNLGNETGS
jgi:mRNA-degrading endonuclease RelE of RelBE toxin-antitoxin system